MLHRVISFSLNRDIKPFVVSIDLVECQSSDKADRADRAPRALIEPIDLRESESAQMV
jgi:hypothetical protein